MKKIGIHAPFLESHHKTRIEGTAALCGYKITYFTDPEDAAARMNDCEILFGVFPPEIIKNATQLRWFASSWAGVDVFLDDTVYADPDNVILTNSSGCYGITISEAMLMMILMMFRTMPGYFHQSLERGWDNLGEMRSIYGSSFTIIGTGDIGRNLALRVKAMGAKVVRGVRRDPSKLDPAFDEMYGTDRLTDAIQNVDVLVLCVPGTDETQRILSKEMIDKLSPRTLVVNVGRGSAIDQEALVDALNAQRIWGAALDVTYPEPLPADHPLWTAHNTLIMPHVSGQMTVPVTRDLAVQKFCANLKAYCAGEPMSNIVDRKKGY